MEKELLIQLKDFVTEYTTDLIFWIQENGTIVYINQVAVSTLGYTKEEICLQKKSWDLVIGLTPQRWSRLVNLLKINQPKTFYNIQRRKDNSTYPTKTILVKKEIEKTVCICGIVTNYEKIQQVETQLYFSQFAIEKSDDMIIWITQEGNIVHVNEAACNKMGYTFEEFKNITIFDFDPYQDTKYYKKNWEHIKSEKVSLIETVIKTKSNELKAVEIKSNYINHNGVEYNCAFFRDIGKRRKRVELLQLTHESLNQIEDMIIWTKPNGDLIYFNDSIGKKLGYTRAEFKKLKKNNFIIGYSKSNQNKYRDRLNKDKKFLGECTLKKLDGSYVFAEISTTQVKFEGEFINCTVLSN